MSYGKITEQELSPELLKKINQGGSGSGSNGVVFMKEGEEIDIDQREPGVLYILELDNKKDKRSTINRSMPLENTMLKKMPVEVDLD